VATDGGIEAEAQLIQALVAPVDGIAQANQNRLRSQTSIALSGAHEVEMARTTNTGRECLDAGFNVLLCSGDQLGSRGGGGSPHIRNKIRDGEVCLVTDRG